MYKGNGEVESHNLKKNKIFVYSIFKYGSTNESQSSDCGRRSAAPSSLLRLLLGGCFGEREGKLCKALDKPPLVTSQT